MNIELNIPNKGNVSGTCGWLAEKLQKAKLKYSSLKGGGLGIWMTIDGVCKDELIAYVSQLKSYALYPDEAVEKDGATGYYITPSCPDVSQDYGCIFKFLTPAAQDYFREFQLQLISVLKDRVENDDAVIFQPEIQPEIQ